MDRPTLKALGAALYVLITLVCFWLVLIRFGVVAAWMFGALACAVPYWIPDNRPDVDQ